MDDLTKNARHLRVDMLRRQVKRMEFIAQSAVAGDCFTIEPTASVFDRVYGGQSLAEAMYAAARTVEQTRTLHSAHCYFLRLGDPAKPVHYLVDRLRDTRTFSIRQVRAEQDGRTILSAMFSFSTASTGITHQTEVPVAPAPEALVSRDVALIRRFGQALPQNCGIPWPIDLRHADQPPWDPSLGDGRHRIWMRADDPIPDDPLLHAALLLFASDLTMSEAVINQHGIVWEDLIDARGLFGASLDHAFWLHAPVRIDEWILHVQESTRAIDGRGFATGRFFDARGVLVASVAQEIFIKEAEGEG